MAAKKAKGWRSGRREGRSRMVQMTRHLVVSEGKETEPRYFEALRAALGGKQPESPSSSREPASIRSTARLRVEHCHAPETFDHVWLVFDRTTSGDRLR
ncbi:MAG: RloB domain-containing protein [Slackia sp.]